VVDNFFISGSPEKWIYYLAWFGDVKLFIKISIVYIKISFYTVNYSSLFLIVLAQNYEFLIFMRY